MRAKLHARLCEMLNIADDWKLRYCGTAPQILIHKSGIKLTINPKKCVSQIQTVKFYWKQEKTEHTITLESLDVNAAMKDAIEQIQVDNFKRYQEKQDKEAAEILGALAGIE
jgi:hypothetical protein